ncbi:hypothetical protein B0H16DRAFT_3399 [Mycena metata]|uniref:Uncharacterized protein n=1 Tax=Mycena metata TaxID=1033252 RepID=A0AAD7KH91_9AGAR|nr:hypothetical protein B0H16DRAFT_3399 [Mycena metata]
MMLATSNSGLKIFMSQNDGRPFIELQDHLATVWGILQNFPTQLTEEHEEEETPRKQAIDVELQLLKQIRRSVYIFVAPKVLHRAKKHLQVLKKLESLAQADDQTTILDRDLAANLHVVAFAARAVFDTGLKQLDSRADWINFVPCITRLYKMIRREDYEKGTLRLHHLAKQSLNLDTKKIIGKIIKVESAIATLWRLVISPKRRWICGLQLTVVNVPIPAVHHFSLSRDNNNITFNAKVHSECELVAQVAQRREELSVDGFLLIPYIACSKLHCLACYLWMEAFGEVHDSPIAYDGSHGGLKTGWFAPRYVEPMHSTMLERMHKTLSQYKLGQKGSASYAGIEPNRWEPEDPEEDAALKSEFCAIYAVFSGEN